MIEFFKEYVAKDKIYTMPEISEIVYDIAEKYGVEKAYVFGSYAYGNAEPESEIDFYIMPGKIKGIWELSGFIEDLEHAFHKKVGVATSIYNKSLADAIRKEMVLVYDHK